MRFRLPDAVSSLWRRREKIGGGPALDQNDWMSPLELAAAGPLPHTPSIELSELRDRRYDHNSLFREGKFLGIKNDEGEKTAYLVKAETFENPAELRLIASMIEAESAYDLDKVTYETFSAARPKDQVLLGLRRKLGL